MSDTYTDRVIRRALLADEDHRHLLGVNLHVLYEITSPQAFAELRERGIPVRFPKRSLAVPDHVIETNSGRTGSRNPKAQHMLDVFAQNVAEAAIPYVALDNEAHGIVHLVAGDEGHVGPGDIVVCGDSHTSTLGALGALAWGIGTSEVAHVLATQAIWTHRQPTVGLRFEGSLSDWVSAKDMMLYACGKLTPEWGIGRRIEFLGAVLKDQPMSARFTMCNLAPEIGSRSALVRPDDLTFQHLRDRMSAERFDAYAALAAELLDGVADPDDVTSLDIDGLEPQVTWGTNLGQVASVSGSVPERWTGNGEAYERALRYVALEGGQPLSEVTIQHAFIGSCTNGRVADIQQAAEVARGRRVAPGVRAVIVPGSRRVSKEAERLGYRASLEAAGFEWREPGCSSCAAINGDTIPPGERCISSTNRNFEGRQGPGAITHLASPATVAASAVVGRIADPRELMS
jgi:3-isopropylmalate/(R)-2-methylmalate dehydratase large subunit